MNSGVLRPKPDIRVGGKVKDNILTIKEFLYLIGEEVSHYESGFRVHKLCSSRAEVIYHSNLIFRDQPIH
ncbi:MAG: hypothetical protein DDT29_02190 [Dehalococcoidia bacterium]|nr:hypothetical protein [Bacillota bacterium]